MHFQSGVGQRTHMSGPNSLLCGQRAGVRYCPFAGRSSPHPLGRHRTARVLKPTMYPEVSTGEQYVRRSLRVR